jgi:uncharacterized protein YgiM (DUF1202 family)
MKWFLFLLLTATLNVSVAQDKWYVAAKNGLSIRENPDVKSAVIGKIPYGTAITIAYPDSISSISVEGLMGAWAKVTYAGKQGFIINSYLLPEAPPKASVKTMKAYLAQLSIPAGTTLVVKRGNMNNIEEGGTETKKQLYKNGAEYHSVSGYEWHNDTYFLPDFTTKQGFILLRLLPEFSSVFAEGDSFPLKNATIKKKDIEYDIKVESEMIGEEKWIKRILIEFADGSINTFEMFQLGNQLVISFGGGV